MQPISNTPWSASQASPADVSSTSSSSTAAGAATVTANDFLTLLVTELKNQDPTANTDPNAYVNQLVQVNSLQQLIQINQDTTPPPTTQTQTQATGGSTNAVSQAAS
jgi:flagellar basal-body rod modification protein FlgD